MNKVKVPNTVSYMMTVPKDKQEIKTPEAILYRLGKTKELKISDVILSKHSNHPVAVIEYKGKKYNIEFYTETFTIPKGYVFMHKFAPDDLKVFQQEFTGVTTVMKYDENPLECYHLQLKFMQCIIPNMAGAVDFNTERVLSGVWLGMAAMSNTLPAPYHLCAVSAVSESPESKTVWMHTHGLNRCGFCEFEIINADKERVNECGNILTCIVNNILCSGSFPDEKQPFSFANFSKPEYEFKITWLDYKTAVEKYDPKVVGGKNDHQVSHNMFVASVFAYMSESDEKNNVLTDINDIPLEQLKNAACAVPAPENNRASQLARERLGFLRDGVNLHNKSKALVKICLAFDRNGSKAMEYVWINLHRIDNQMIYGVVETPPVFSDAVKKGDAIKVEISALTDWILYTENYPVTPDTSYLIVEEMVAYKQHLLNKPENTQKSEQPELASADDISGIDDIIKNMD